MLQTTVGYLSGSRAYMLKNICTAAE